MRLKLVSPAAFADLARATIGQVVETAAAAVTIPMRAVAVLGQTELLVSRITVLADEAESLIRRVGTVVTDAEGMVVETRAIAASASGITEAAGAVVTRASTLSQAAEGVIGQAGSITVDATAVVRRAGTTAADATELLDSYAATLRKGAPLAARFVDELSPDEVTAAIRMVDQLPRLREHLVDDVMPLLAKLDQVGPDLHKLLEVTEDLRLAIAGIPGLRMLKRRGEEKTENG